MNNRDLLQSVFGVNKPDLPSIVPKVTQSPIVSPETPTIPIEPLPAPITPQDSASIQTLLWSGPTQSPNQAPNKIPDPTQNMSKNKGWGQT